MTAPVLDITNPASANAAGADLEESAAALVARMPIAVVTPTDLHFAVLQRNTLADMRRRVVDYFAPLKSLAYQLHKTLCDRENAILKPLDAHDRAIRDAMSVFKRDQDRIRRDQEAAEQARRRQELEAQAAHEAALLEAHGEHELAAAVVDDAISAAPPVVALPDLVKDAGAKFRRVWKWRYTGGPVDVDDTPAAIMASAVDRMPREFLMVDTRKVGAYVRAMKSSGAIPGLEIYSVDEPVR